MLVCIRLRGINDSLVGFLYSSNSTVIRNAIIMRIIISDTDLGLIFHACFDSYSSSDNEFIISFNCGYFRMS